VLLCARAKFERLDVQKEYDKRQAMGKDNINLVVIGNAALSFLGICTCHAKQFIS